MAITPLQKLNWQRPENLNKTTQAVFNYTSVSTSKSLMLVKALLPGYWGNRFSFIHHRIWGRGGEGCVWTGREGTAPTAKTHVPAKVPKTPVKQKTFKYKLNRQGGAGGSQLLPYVSEDRTAAKRSGSVRARSALSAGPHATACPGPPLTARLRERQPRARRPWSSPAAAGLTQKIRLRKTRTVLEEVMPHCPIAPAAPQPPAARLLCGPLSSAPPLAPPHVTQTSRGGGAGSLRWRPFASRGGRGRRNLRWRTAPP